MRLIIPNRLSVPIWSLRMAHELETATQAVRTALDGRRLIWFGIRGEDGEALLRLPELAASYSIIAPLRTGQLPAHANIALETGRHARPDLDRYDLDFDPHPAAGEFKRLLLREVSSRCVLMPYRASAVVSALGFSMSDTMTVAGLFKDRQSAFEHKPWVEQALARRGVAGLDWRYVADEHRDRVRRMVADGPHILRANRTSGGVGIALVSSPDEIDEVWPSGPDGFVGVAPFLDPSIPVNLSGVVFDDGGVRLHPLSVQLIGIGSCTDRPFGYCGNDFGAAKALGTDILAQIDALGHIVGTWLYEERYRGMFGVDALVFQEHVRFIEVNARFQGSSAPSAEIANGLEVPDLFLEHLAASLGLPPSGAGLTIPEWTRLQPPRSQVVLHNITGGDVVAGPLRPGLGRNRRVRFAQLPPPGLRIEPGAAMGRVTFERSITDTGYAIDAIAEEAVSGLAAASIA
jgi:hypothetical protein